MSSTLIDSNVLIDLFDEESEWREWSDAKVTPPASAATSSSIHSSSLSVGRL